jgi:lactate dehydrogenase-like 2-hydroxyacid dehydrogenase
MKKNFQVAVVDWAPQPRGDKKCVVEKDVLGDLATLRYYLCDKEEDWKGSLLKADAILVWHNTQITENIIHKLEKCQCIVRNGAGYDSVDYITAATADIPVCNVPDYGVDEVSDHAIALALNLCRQILPTHEECKKLDWGMGNRFKIRRFNKMNFGVVGLGRIGGAVALKAKALGFNVCFYDPYLSNGTEKTFGIRRSKNFNEFISNMDVISINCPLTDETKHMFAEKEFTRMSKDAFLVNTARGPIVNKNDLFKALNRKKIAGAAFDVFEDEPLKTKKEASTPNLIMTSHSAYYSIQSVYEMRKNAATVIKNVLTKKAIENCVNCKFLPRNFVK